MRKKWNQHQKARIALSAMKGDKTFAELASAEQVHPSQISEWKTMLEKGAHRLFETQDGARAEEKRIAELERMIGRRETEIEWLKKTSRTLPSRKND